MTRPKLEYSRMELASKMLPPSGLTAPWTRKAMILRVSGSTMVFATVPILPESWTLKIGRFRSLEFAINIPLL